MQVKMVLWAWWRHEMAAFSALLVICAGHSAVTGEFPSQRPATRSFDAFFDPRLGNLVTGFMISDESGNRFFRTAVTDYWQDKAACRHDDQQKL